MPAAYRRQGQPEPSATEAALGGGKPGEPEGAEESPQQN